MSDRLNRRTVLRFGGGVIALAVGIGVGVVDRRLSKVTPENTAANTLLPNASATSTTTTVPATTTAVTPNTTPSSIPIITDEVTNGVIAVGRAYLQQEPSEADLDTLLRALPALDGDVVTAARGLITADFKTRNIVTIDGWVLARSEARAAAVLTLACSDEC